VNFETLPNSLGGGAYALAWIVHNRPVRQTAKEERGHVYLRELRPTRRRTGTGTIGLSVMYLARGAPRLASR
jgi:hypothetical protein